MNQRRGQAHRGASEARRRMNGSASNGSRRMHQLAQEPRPTTAALTEANQRVLNEFMGLSMETMQASARIFMQVQQSAMEMLRESQAAALRVQMAWPQMFKDPMRWYQSMCHESMASARKAFDAINGTSDAVSGSVNRLQSSAEQAGTKIEHALTSAASRMKAAA